MPGTAPFEIVAAPFAIYVAPVGTTFPDVSAAPSGSWTLLGTSGDKNYDEDGVNVHHQQNIETFTPVGLTAPRKAFRTSEGLVIDFNLVDISAAQYGKVLNNATVTTTAAGVGTGGNLNLPLLMGLDVSLFALVAKGNWSAAAGTSGFMTQYEVPIVFQSGEPEPNYAKDEPAMLACEFTALWDSTLGFGKLRSQNAAPS